MSTVILFACLLGGVLLGSMRFSKPLSKHLDQISSVGVIILLFTMGIGLGMKIHLEDLKILGLQAIVFTLFTIIFSIIVVEVLCRFFLKEGRR